MNDLQLDLMRRLERFEIGDARAALGFIGRLARDNGWSVEYASRVVAEYKRFVFLAMEAGHPVTPSDEVDQAWHLHMVYTRSYWDEMCAQVLGRLLHHGPTKGGRAENDKFEDWYGRTLRSYERFFGAAAPADIWPAAAVRFGLAPYFRRINTRVYFLLPRRAVKRAALIAGGVTVVAGLSGCGVLLAQWQGVSTAVVIGIAGLVAVILVASLLARRKGASGSGCGGGGCGAGGCGASHHPGSGCSGDGGDGGSGCGGSGCGGGGCGGGCGG